MANLESEAHFSTENISFLDDCFDNSFTFQSSIKTVKDYISEQNDKNLPRRLPLSQKPITSSQNRSLLIDTLRNSQILSQNKTAKNRKLKEWGLPPEIATKYEEKGITEMFQWQIDCLSNPKVLFDCCNLVYSAPTSAGKTLVAEIITIKTILERQKKVIIILPFVSIVREKMFYLRDILSGSGVRVEGFMGSQGPPGGFQAVHVAICTIEKANSLINRLLDEGNISELGAVIVDELHLLGDPSRGYILELLLTKIKYVTSKYEDILIQIIGMSATLPNLEVLANWLNAELFVTQFRPIPLDEFCLINDKFYNKDGDCVDHIKNTMNIEGDSVLKICLETIQNSCSILIFCTTKSWCENLAQSIALSFYKFGCGGNSVGTTLRSQLKTEAIQEVMEQLKNCPVGLDQVLKNTVSFGVSYHHAGLTFDERDIIEGAFKTGAIRVLVATSTLSSGVNLPARRVIIRSPVFQRQPINILTYKQMIGRAGRMGKDTKGESILICTENERKIGFELMTRVLDPVKSCIDSEDKYMRAVLEMIASQVLCTKDELDLYSKCTLLFIQGDTNISSQNFLLENTLEQLKNYELVRVQVQGDEENYVATALGKACLSSSMAPNDGLSLFCELQRARQCLVLDTDLHLIYLVTPYSVSSQWSEIDWLHLLTLWESLTKAMKKVGELVGVQERFIVGCVRGNSKSNSNKNKVNVHKRFYTALALQDLVNEVPLSEVSTKFQCARGFLQSLQQGAATFAGMVTAFCRQLGWKNMEMLVSQFQDRLHFGIHSDLLELMKLPSLNGTRARTLFNSGLETISSIASADANTIENILLKTIPFQSEKTEGDDDSDDVRKRNRIKNIWITGHCGMTIKEAAQNLIDEARSYLVHEIGVADIKWAKDSEKSIVDDVASLSKINSVTPSEGHVLITVNQNSTQDHYGTQTSTPNNSLMSQMEVNDYKDNDKFMTRIQQLQPQVAVNNNVTNESILDSNDGVCKIKSAEIDTDYTKDNVKLLNDNPIMKESDNNKASPSLSQKDDIKWESLNFTDAAIVNITKLRTSDKMFSPNISFGEYDELPTVDNPNTVSKCNSTKDISLFSSEGDNSSLFEESLPLDLIPSKLLDTIEPTISKKQDIVINTSLIMSSNTMLNAFNSTLSEPSEDDEDFKLVYEDDRPKENVLNHVNNDHHHNANSNIVNLQCSSPNKRHIESEKELQPVIKKKKILEDISAAFVDTISDSQPRITSALSKLFTMKLADDKINCYLLRGVDVVNNLHIVQALKEVSLYFYSESNSFISPPKKIIGRSVLKEFNLMKADEFKNNDVDINIAMYFHQTCIFLDLRSVNCIEIVNTKIRDWILKGESRLKLFCSKAANVCVKRLLNINLQTNNCVDVSLNEWLLDNDAIIPHINFLSKKYSRVDLQYVTVDGRRKPYKSLNMVESSCVSAWSIWTIAEKQEREIVKSSQIDKSTIDTERKISKILANCEHYGLTVDKDLASRLLIDVRNSLETLEKKAFKLCGYHFNFNSSNDVAKVLGLYNGRKVSTKKTVLNSHNSPMASLVIYWRKLNSILTQTLYPLTEKACNYSCGNRINPIYTMFTCTGRISMHKPNLQNVPRTFCIPAEYLTLNKSANSEVVEFNCRNIFKATEGYVIVSADYCQLEMRILTHFSEDPVLMQIMSSDLDVFKSIAASWSHRPEEQVDDDLRQKAKQLCYGIIYGMGNKTLSLQLDVTEIEAAMFMDDFFKAYPAVKSFTQRIIDECRSRGYIETLTKRRRYLPGIKSNVGSRRSAAERQAVNTTIQGSAADIAKAAMCNIDTRIDNLEPKPRLILQMHDELIYEVPQNKKEYFIRVLKEVMEGTMKLNVPLPVKIKSGYTWGTLEDVMI